MSRRARAAHQYVVAIAITCLGLLLFLVSVGIGLPLSQTFLALFGHGDPYSSFVVQTLRLPRAVAAAVVGAALGVSGGLLQGVVRNPLASPDVVGVTAGASAAAVVAVMWLHAGTFETELAAFVGAIFAASVSLGLARAVSLGPYGVPLVGIGVSAVFIALTNFLLTRADVADTQRAFVWLIGSLDTQTWNQCIEAGLVTLVLIPMVLLMTRSFQLLVLGSAKAHSLGIHVARTQTVLVVLASLLAAVATATAGPIAFVALVAPHVAKFLFRHSAPSFLSMALVGAVLLLASDLVAARGLWTQVPVGVVTPLVGGPYLLWLLQRAGRVVEH